MSARTILPLAYLGNVQWFAHLLADDCVIDIDEYYIKQSYRNRTVIAAANGLMPLTVQVANANRPRMKMRDVRIDYSKRWQHQHWVSILSAYKSSPYFDHYAEELEPFYRREWCYLVDYNMDYLQTLLRLLGAKCEVRLSEQYVEAEQGDLDLRPKHNEGSTFVAEPYFQVFSDRMPFEANLSVLDLLMCEGPAAVSAVLMRCQL